ncbi:DUF6241 domain-containing protein [Clostridium sp. DL1XJH146]
MRRKNNIIAILCVAIICVAAYIGYLKVIGPQTVKTSNKEYNEVLENSDENTLDKETATNYLEEKNITIREEKLLYEDIHRMANTLIIAEDGKIWGKDTITDEKCNTLIIEITASDYDDKERLLSILNRWKEDDFSEGVDDHNYVWNRLGGTIGRAKSLKEEFK